MHDPRACARLQGTVSALVPCFVEAPEESTRVPLIKGSLKGFYKG